jgi:hypothetical protein
MDYVIRNFRMPWEEPEDVAKGAVNSIVSAIPVFGMIFDVLTTVGMDAIKKSRGAPVDKSGYSYLTEVDVPLFSSIGDIAKGITRGDLAQIGQGVGAGIGIPAGGPILRSIKNSNLAITHGNARYLITSKYKVNSEFDQIDKAERAVPSTSRSPTETDKMHEWAKKQKAGWSPKKLLQFNKYTETTRKLKAEENRRSRQPK